MISQVVAHSSLYLCPPNPLEGPISEYRLRGQRVNMRFGDPTLV